ncbi:MurR/RpiR family transcriptional regulator [Salipiger marinus]|jgi:DNA-binding MurR/RpiR family transcriptional regulator|uniref:Transcriptional regulator, RpiR family n=1 Tax=Salipiger marinus TaxID=555512 RepID=A0A1G8KR52_9RHOB|nr:MULTISPECIES: MurR/RpiR family transcriptional regulator [Salipiger]HBM62212.1 MurR/RpiR family transcriptional regulator [Citreicella sp.]MCD1617976.1 MurR/RpiR family transcriptional regulator [Salipiger manganoxidans]MEB3418653.1 MurR/RpiR family transcriptional regulator [Salipiger manganoxidans]SDI45908.1 transcriptional regulator, RpiR family [Salipiger marinus]HBS98391.1 MurR/RpiR family transcriptional regulator [Citreicella sp.]
MTNIDIVNMLREISGSDTGANSRLARIILEDVDFASRAAIADLAARAEVSEPTVTRFCRSLGFDGMRDFKHKLAQIMVLGGPYLYPRPVETDDSSDRVAEAITAGIERAIALVRSHLTRDDITRILPALVAAKQVTVFGSGGVSSLGAIEMQTRLFRLGIPIVAQTDGQLQRMIAAISGPEHVIVAISVSGQVQSIVESIELARQYGVTTIAITKPGSRLAASAQIVLPFLVPPDDYLYKPTPARYALLFIIDLIATAVAEHIGPDVLEKLRRVRVALSGINSDDPIWPIGD